jgi:N-acetylmuramoyl-L-alanine amidase
MRLITAVAALSLAGCAAATSRAAPEIRIVDRPISFSEQRVEMTREYIRDHYGIDAPDIEIVPRIIVLHWTAVDDLEGSFRAFDREALAGRPALASAGQVNVSIHFLVDRDGAVYRLMPEIWLARHVIGLNYDAIGVENVGGAGGAEDLTDAQVEANIRLVRYLAEKYTTIEYLIGHSEYRAFEGHPLWRELDPGYRTWKIDPGGDFMDAVRSGTADLGLEGPPAAGAAALPPGAIPHEAWDAEPPVGQAADADRRNLAPGDSLRFHDFTIELLAMGPAPAAAQPGTAAVTRPGSGLPTEAADAGTAPDRAVLRLDRGGESHERVVGEGEAFNWRGFHVAVLAVHARPGELGGGLTELEVSTVASLPPGLAAAARAGGAEQRLRIPHEIHTITLHHSGSPQPLGPEDDPIAKLRGLQAWGRAEKNWWDVPYHFLIDLDGNVYQGRDVRYMGETNTEYDPRGHLLISVIGNYSLQEPTPAQIAAITRVMAWGAERFDVPLNRIYGHGDHAETSCPGTHLRRYLDDGTFTRGVRARLEAAR